MSTRPPARGAAAAAAAATALADAVTPAFAGSDARVVAVFEVCV